MDKKIIVAGIISGVIILGCIFGGVIFLLSMYDTEDKQDSQTSEIKKLNGWKEEGDNRYYYKDNEKKIGWIEENGKWYYLGTDGRMRTGWIRDNNNWYYMNDDGTMAVNTTVDGCYLNENGLIEDTPKQSAGMVDNFNTLDIQYTTYTNGRYGFSIDYPIEFIPMQPPDNGDGRCFQRRDGQVYVKSYGSNNSLSKSIEYYYNMTIENISGVITYKALNKNSYAVSWIQNRQINYEFSRMGKGSINTFIISYPEVESEKYDNMVDHIYNTFKTPGIDEAH